MNVLSVLFTTLTANISPKTISGMDIIDFLGLEGNVLLVVKRDELGIPTYHQVVSVNIADRTIDLKAGTGPNTFTYPFDDVKDLSYTSVSDINGYWSILALRGNYDLCHNGYRVLSYVPKLELYLKHVIVEVTIFNALLNIPDVYVLVVDDVTEPLDALARFMGRLPSYLIALNKECSYVVHNTLMTRIQRSDTFQLNADDETISLNIVGKEVCKTEVLGASEIRELCKTLEPFPSDNSEKSKRNKRFKKPQVQSIKSNEAVAV